MYVKCCYDKCPPRSLKLRKCVSKFIQKQTFRIVTVSLYLTLLTINYYRRKSHGATCQTELKSLKLSYVDGAFCMAGHLLLSTHWAHVFNLLCSVTCFVSYHIMQTVIPQSSISLLLWQNKCVVQRM